MGWRSAPLGVVLVVLGLLYARLATQRAVVAGGMLVLHRLIGSRRIPIDDVVWVDPVLTGLRRAPHLGLRSGEIVRLDPFSVPNLFVASSPAASALAAKLHVPHPGLPGSGTTWHVEPAGEFKVHWWSWGGGVWIEMTPDDAEWGHPGGWVTPAGRPRPAEIMAAMPDQPNPIRGLDDPTVIDMVMLSPEEDRIDLIMVHTGVWDKSNGLLLRLEEKWQHYVGFAIHGGLQRMYPDYAHLPWRIVLDCRVQPDERTKDFVVRAHEATRNEGGDFVVRLIKKP